MNEQPEPATAPQEAGAEAKPPTEPEAKPQAEPETKAQADPEAKPKAAPAKSERRRPSQGGGGGMPNRRIREPMPALDEARYSGGPRLKDLDDEIAGEMEAALGGLSEKELFGAETSEQVRQQAAATAAADHGRKQGKVVAIHGPDVFIDVPGGRSQGVLPMMQFLDEPPKIGDTVEVSIEGYDRANGLLLLTRLGSAVVADWATVSEGMVVEAKVLETNKGGLSVDVNGIRGFMPISHIELFRVESAEQYVNQKLMCLVTDVDPEERNLVVSRRALLEKQREEQREKLWQELAEGQVHEGIVRSVRDFGAFVDLGGVDGLLHVSEISWKRGTDASQLLQPGQKVKVAVIKIDHEKRKLSLSLKRLEGSPWDTIYERFAIGEVVKGTVTRLMDFGAFVELEAGIEGLAHISELANRRVSRVGDIVKEGDEVQVKVLAIDTNQQRISLSIRAALKEEVDAETAEEGADEPAPPPRPRNLNLRGGIGGQTFQLPEQPE